MSLGGQVAEAAQSGRLSTGPVLGLLCAYGIVLTDFTELRLASASRIGYYTVGAFFWGITLVDFESLNGI